MSSHSPNHPMRVGIIGIPTLVLVLIGFSALAVRAEIEPPPPSASSDDASHIAGELLVKFTEEAAAAIEQAREAGRLPGIGDEALDTLFAKYGVKTIEPAFPNAKDIETIRLKFPDRSRRAPPGAQAPDLSRTYKVTFDAVHDFVQVFIDFTTHPFVEHVEPNTIATTKVPDESVP